MFRYLAISFNYEKHEIPYWIFIKNHQMWGTELMYGLFVHRLGIVPRFHFFRTSKPAIALIYIYIYIYIYQYHIKEFYVFINILTLNEINKHIYKNIITSSSLKQYGTGEQEIEQLLFIYKYFQVYTFLHALCQLQR